MKCQEKELDPWSPWSVKEISLLENLVLCGLLDRARVPGEVRVSSYCLGWRKIERERGWDTTRWLPAVWTEPQDLREVGEKIGSDMSHTPSVQQMSHTTHSLVNWYSFWKALDWTMGFLDKHQLTIVGIWNMSHHKWPQEKYKLTYPMIMIYKLILSTRWELLNSYKVSVLMYFKYLSTFLHII